MLLCSLFYRYSLSTGYCQCLECHRSKGRQYDLIIPEYISIQRNWLGISAWLIRDLYVDRDSSWPISKVPGCSNIHYKGRNHLANLCEFRPALMIIVPGALNLRVQIWRPGSWCKGLSTQDLVSSVLNWIYPLLPLIPPVKWFKCCE